MVELKEGQDTPGTVRKRSPKMPVPKPKITLKKLAKSKSNEFNLIIAPAILAVLAACGVSVPMEVVVGAYAVVNFILRLVTDKGIADK